MEERKIDLSTVIFPLVLQKILQDLEIPYVYFQDEDGSFFCGCEVFTAHGEGDTFDEALNDMLEIMRESAEIYCSDLSYWIVHNPPEFFYALKIFRSSDKELRQCLSGKVLKDF